MPITHPIHIIIRVGMLMNAANTLDRLQKHKLPLKELLIFLENYFNKPNLLLYILIPMRPESISRTIQKSGLFNLRSNCLIFIMAFLEYIKKKIIAAMFIVPGMMK
jgi:hypothetical protein